jgi:TonB-linked SusC/RagA family outer membrane protein
MKQTLRWRKRLLQSLLIMCCLVQAVYVQAQTKIITGVVKEEQSGEALPGVSVLVKGTTRGTITDVNGAFSIEGISEEDVIIFSFVGYKQVEVAASGKTVIDALMPTDITTLDEIVVVGYGTQKKSVVTGSISGVKGSDLASMPITRIEQSLQGRVSGVTIASNSGQPGSASTIRVRGITSLNNNDPLWVVDGVVVDNGGIGYINQSDIESVEVLKDAASQAIYGARGASGVILVTTKKGKEGKLSVTYNGFYGNSAPARRLDLLNATQYATLRNEASVAGGGSIIYNDPASLGKGTNWQNAIFNNHAQRQNHELSISGGNDKSTFYTSFGYLTQQGIVATDISNYKRVNLRLNSTHKVTKWLTFGQNVGYAHTKSTGLGNTNSEFGGPLSSAINLDPITPLVETDPTKVNASPYNNTGVLKDANGNPYGISTQGVGQELTNPLAYIKTRIGNYNWADDVVGNVYLQAEPIKGLTLRSSVGTKLAFYGSESFTPVFYLNSSTKTTQNSFNRASNQTLNWNIENTISYTKNFDKHNVTILLGQGAYMDNNTRGINVTFYNLPVNNFDDASMNFKVPTASRNSDGYENQLHTVNSLFARLNYAYNEKYLLTAVMRRDGSSRFGSNNKYGYFPSFSAGWVASQESFWPSNNVVNFLKVRGGYGVVGNDNIGDFAYLSTIGSGRNYTIGNTPQYANGFSPNAPSNPDLKWEQTSQTNIGFEATVLSDFNLTFDWYKKVTTGILRNRRIPGYVGAIADPAANVADMQNTGIELELGYKKQVGDFRFSLNGNVSYLQNKVTYLDKGLTFLAGGETIQNTTQPITRIEVGHSISSFYGYKKRGIFQTQEEINAYQNADGGLIQPNAKPGDFIWADLDGNGLIDDKDRTFLGKPLPSWTYGATLNVAYKGFDVVIFGQGVSGNKIFQGLRRLDVANANWQTSAMGRWTGPGTSNEIPRLTTDDTNHNYTNPSEFYLQKGDYFRIKTLQIGYTLPKEMVSKLGLQKTRIYIMSENLKTFTKYTGFDPEIGGNVMGIDRGIYPQARSFMVGLNLAF